MTDNKNSRIAIRFSVPFSKEQPFYHLLVFINSYLDVIEIYRDVLHTRIIVHFVFLPSLSWEQCHESFRRLYEYTDIIFEDVHESYFDPES